MKSVSTILATALLLVACGKSNVSSTSSDMQAAINSGKCYTIIAPINNMGTGARVVGNIRLSANADTFCWELVKSKILGSYGQITFKQGEKILGVFVTNAPSVARDLSDNAHFLIKSGAVLGKDDEAHSVDNLAVPLWYRIMNGHQEGTMNAQTKEGNLTSSFRIRARK